MIERYRPGTDIDPSELNGLQDDYDATLFQSWKSIGRAGPILLGDGLGATTLSIVPTKRSSLNSGTMSALWLDCANELLVGHASAGRTGKLRLVVDVATNDTPPGASPPGVRIAQVSLNPATGVDGSGNTTYGAAVAGSAIFPGSLGYVGFFPPGAHVAMMSDEFGYPPAGGYAVRMALAPPVPDTLVLVWIALQHRQI